MTKQTGPGRKQVRQTGQCPACGRWIRVLANGVMGYHPTSTRPGAPVCPATYEQQPVSR